MNKPAALKSSRYEASKVSVVLLAAGHGKRMLPLTSNTPKPLLQVAGKALIEHHIHRLSDLGFRHIIVNTAYLGEKIQQYLGNGARYGVEIDYSDESTTGALETAGGIKKSLSLIKSDPFLVINSDIYTDFNFKSLLDMAILDLRPSNQNSVTPNSISQRTSSDKLGCLVLVENPEHNHSGDFNVNSDIQFDSQSTSTMTFSGIALYRKKMFLDLPEGKLALGPILKQMIRHKALGALPHYGTWTDVGTPQRLAELNTVKNK